VIVWCWYNNVTHSSGWMVCYSAGWLQ